MLDLGEDDTIILKLSERCQLCPNLVFLSKNIAKYFSNLFLSILMHYLSFVSKVYFCKINNQGFTKLLFL